MKIREIRGKKTQPRLINHNQITLKTYLCKKLNNDEQRYPKKTSRGFDAP